MTFSKEDRLSIGCPVPKILASEERPRPAAHTQNFPLIQYELARSLRSLARNNVVHDDLDRSTSKFDLGRSRWVPIDAS